MVTQVLKTTWEALDQRFSLRLTLLKVTFGIIWMTLASQICFFLPFSPVPITLGPNAAVFLGLMLGPRYAAASLTLWAAMGLMGAPLFAGWQAFISPKTGYILGYIPSAYCMGYLMQRIQKKSAGMIFAAALVAHVPLYAMGLLWLSSYVCFGQVLALGLIPFLPGLIIKTGILSGVASRLLERESGQPSP